MLPAAPEQRQPESSQTLNAAMTRKECADDCPLKNARLGIRQMIEGLRNCWFYGCKALAASDTVRRAGVVWESRQSHGHGGLKPMAHACPQPFADSLAKRKNGRNPRS